MLRDMVVELNEEGRGVVRGNGDGMVDVGEGVLEVLWLLKVEVEMEEGRD